MPRWLPSLGRLLETKDAATQRGSAGPTFVFAGNPYIGNWSMDRIVKDGYEKVIPVFKAIDAIADKVSDWPIKCMQGTEPDWKQIPDDPILDLLNGQTNIIDGDSKFFRYRLVSQFLMSKAGVFVEVVPSRGGGISALNLLPPGRTFPIPNADTFLDGFEIQLPNGDRPRLPVYDPKKKAGVIWIRKPHPIDPYSGITPLEAAGISIDLDFYARLYNRNFLLNDGRGGQLIAVKGGLSPEDALELKARFSPGMNGAGRTTVVEADAISVQDTAISPRDAQYAELRSITKEDLLLALGTPESVLGNASGSTFDNADVEKENWLEVTCAPIGNVIARGMNALTEGGMDDGRILVHDTSNEWVLGRAKRQKQQEYFGWLNAGVISYDEFRGLCELDPDQSPGTNVLWLPVAGKVPVSDKPDLALAASKLVPIAAPPAPAPGAAPGAPGGSPGGSPGGAGAALGGAQTVTDPFEQRRASRQGAMSGAMMGALEGARAAQQARSAQNASWKADTEMETKALPTKAEQALAARLALVEQ